MWHFKVHQPQDTSNVCRYIYAHRYTPHRTFLGSYTCHITGNIRYHTLVVLPTEWLPWLRGLFWCQRLNVKATKEVVSLFLLFSLFQNEERRGNNKETCCLGLDTPIVEEGKPVTMVMATKYCVIVVLYIY